MLLSQNVKVSYNPLLSKLGSLNCLVIEGTGEGKSRGFVNPNVYSLLADPRDGKPVSFVFTDPKGNCAMRPQDSWKPTGMRFGC